MPAVKRTGLNRCRPLPVKARATINEATARPRNTPVVLCGREHTAASRGKASNFGQVYQRPHLSTAGSRRWLAGAASSSGSDFVLPMSV